MGWVGFTIYLTLSRLNCLNEHKTGRGPEGVLIGAEWDSQCISLFIVSIVSMCFLPFYKTGRGVGVLLIGVELGSPYISFSLSSRSRDASLQALHTTDKCLRGLAMMGGEGREGCPVCHQLLVKGGGSLLRCRNKGFQVQFQSCRSTRSL